MRARSASWKFLIFQTEKLDIWNTFFFNIRNRGILLPVRSYSWTRERETHLMRGWESVYFKNFRAPSPPSTSWKIILLFYLSINSSSRTGLGTKPFWYVNGYCLLFECCFAFLGRTFWRTYSTFLKSFWADIPFRLTSRFRFVFVKLGPSPFFPLNKLSNVILKTMCRFQPSYTYLRPLLA